MWVGWLLTWPPRPNAALVFASGLPLTALASWALSRRSSHRWRPFLVASADIHALALLLLAALAVQFADSHGVTTDGVIYVSQMRSAIFDRDLDLASEFARLGQPPRPSQIVPIGPTLLWLPAYLLLAATDALGRTMGMWSAPVDSADLGLTLAYIRAISVTSFLVSAAGLVVLHFHLRRAYGRGISLAATTLLLGATPLVWYMVYEPTMTHAASFGIVALFVVSADRDVRLDIPWRQGLMLGALLGLAFVIRPQEAIFAILPACLLLGERASGAQRLREAVRLGGWGLVGAAPFLLLQALHSTLLLSRESFALAGDEGYLDLLRSRWSETLWSSWHGFFSWTPVAYVAFIGVVCLAVSSGGRMRARAVAAIVITLAMAWVNGATADWAAGWSFGGRRFVSVLAVLAPGLVFVLHQLARRPTLTLSVIGAAAVLWNQLLVAQYTRGLLSADSTATYGHIVRQQAEVLTGPHFVYPFAFPANVWFAARTGLSASDYDLLAPEPLRPQANLAFDATIGPLLRTGWGARAAEDSGALRWFDGENAELVLPLDLPASARVILEVTARTRLLDPPVPVTVTLIVNGGAVATFSPNARRPETATISVASHLWTKGFNRLTFRKPVGTPPVAIYRVTVSAAGEQ